MAVLTALALGGAALHVALAQDVTIYRCVDAKGRTTLRDTPCAKGEEQQTRTMVRPRDAKPAPAPPPPEEEPYFEDVPPPAYAAPPRPLYECITPDNQVYTSDTGTGNPRWVPNWTLGYPVYPFVPGSVSGARFSIGNDRARVSGGTVNVTPAYVSSGAYGGQWVQDVCYELPPADVCNRVRDRRDEIRRRFFNAMPSERDVLRVEERQINDRLDNDCGGR